jgi:hypothetical protein
MPIVANACALDSTADASAINSSSRVTVRLALVFATPGLLERMSAEGSSGREFGDACQKLAPGGALRQ